MTTKVIKVIAPKSHGVASQHSFKPGSYSVCMISFIW